MALVKFGPVVSGASGKLGAVVFHSGNRSNIIAHVPTKSRPPKKFTENAHQDIAYYASYWKTISVADRKAWKTYSLSRPFTDPMGVKKTLTPYQCFMQHNLGYANRPRTGAVIFATPPPNPIATPAIATAAIAAAGAKIITCTTAPPHTALAHITLRRWVQYGPRNGQGSMQLLGFLPQHLAALTITSLFTNNHIDLIIGETITLYLRWTYYVFTPLFSGTPLSAAAAITTIVT